MKTSKLIVMAAVAKSASFLGMSTLLLGGMVASLSGRAVADDAPQQPGIEFFEQHIRPVLVRQCYECHSAKSDSVMGGLLVDSKLSLVQGGDSGAAVVAGDPQASLLINALRQEDFEMPPDGKLPDETIQRFVEWIEMGAPDPRTTDPDQPDSSTTPDATPHWAFLPPQPVEPPEVTDSAWPQTPIDRFVLAELEARGLKPVPKADRHSLVRRIYYDLWGLPPSPQAIDDFLRDDSPNAVAKLVDRLLDSPRFGERWGRHWLDVARYGESTGHERNFLYPYAWRYRDYVIAAFNEDKPYDQFITEQLAGDLLPADNQRQRDQQLVATGLLAIGPRNLLGRDGEFQLDAVDDQINVTSRAILALTVSCARCHDHKFDPISTDEYYSLAGVFLSTQPLYGTVPGTGGGNNRHPSELVPLGAGGQKRQALVLEHNQQIAKVTAELGKAQNRVKKISSLPEKTLAEKQDELAQAKHQLEQVEQRLEELNRSAPKPPSYAMGVREADEIVDTQVRISGDARKKGDTVPRGVLACCTSGNVPNMPTESSGRLQLADWLVNGQNPLTARVAVNRIWHHTFGRGIVPTVDNFGRNGRLPTHPELLDWLALQFQADGWSFKRMIRRIMLSRVYQLSASYNADNHKLDPDNKWRWRWSPKRLEAEAIRDAMLTVSGELELKPPKSGSVVAELGNGCLVRQIDADNLKVDASYRSVYLPNARYFEPELMQVFDGASASLVVGDRAETNVPAQSLFFLNNEFSTERSIAAAERIVSRTNLNQRQQLQLLYRLMFARKPSDSEIDRSLVYIQQMESSEDLEVKPGKQLQLWAGLVQALFSSAEFRYVY